MSDQTQIRTRLAPSPTGDPHVGTAYVGLFDYVWARSQGGQFILRIEDTDQTRSTKASEEAILRALKWIGLQWDEGPDIGGPCGPYRQSERTTMYREAADQLIARGTAYRCFCTAERLEALREQQKREKGPLGYDGLCRSRDPGDARRRAGAGEPHVVRLAVPDEGATAFHDIIRGEISVQNSAIDDQVLLKSDGFPTYHLANVVDDHAMRITHVIRAEEWISSTPKHILLYRAFGWQPPAFAHLPLLRNPDQSKISKRKNPTSLDWYREQGFLPEALLNFLGLMGWSSGRGEEMFSPEEMIAEFRWEQVGKGAPVFDMTKLDWLNGEYIRRLAPAELARQLRGRDALAARLDEPTVLRLLPLAQERMKRLTDYSAVCGFVFEDVAPNAADFVPKKGSAADTAAVLEKAAAALEAVPDWSHDALEGCCRARATAMGWKAGDFFMALRVAVTGSKASPPLFGSMAVVGRERCLARIRAAVALLRSAG